MLKDTKSLGNNKAPACESRGFVLKKKVCFLTHLLFHIILKSLAKKQDDMHVIPYVVLKPCHLSSDLIIPKISDHDSSHEYVPAHAK